jgi:preprotein translocase subunit SecF
MIRIFHNTSFDFIKHWRLAAALTAAFIVLGLASFGFTGGPNYSIEFTGGTLMQLQFKSAPDVSAIRSTVESAGVRGAEITQFGEATEYTVRAQDAADIEEQADGAEGIAKRIETALTQRFGADEVTVVRTEAVGPKVGAELRRGAFLALIITSLISLVYLAFRFDWRFGLAAVLSLVHDVLLTLAFVKLFDIEVSLTVVAAILTVLGYSANDTIIIFDRTRENLRKYRKATLYETLNRSINETLGRSILTHATTLAATLALLFFAGQVLRPFSIVMAFGVVVAVFSSMYVATPLLIYIEGRYPRDAEDKNVRRVGSNDGGASAAGGAKGKGASNARRNPAAAR